VEVESDEKFLPIRSLNDNVLSCEQCSLVESFVFVVFDLLYIIL
jgi:hypothetical protein